MHKFGSIVFASLLVAKAMLLDASCQDADRTMLFNKIQAEAKAPRNRKISVNEILEVAQKNTTSVRDYFDTVKLLGQLVNKSSDPNAAKESSVAENSPNHLGSDPGWQTNAVMTIAGADPGTTFPFPS